MLRQTKSSRRISATEFANTAGGRVRAGFLQGPRGAQAWRIARTTPHLLEAAFVGALLAAVWLFVLSPVASADVGPDGSFTTTQPIVVPSYHGLQPSLGLDYSSNATEGLLGRGWSIEAASTIRRAANRVGVPHWDGNDDFVLDGGLLVPCAGGSSTVKASPSCAHPADGTTPYTTEAETYIRVGFDPSANTWRVWRPNGVVVTYQPIVSSNRGTSEWGVATVADPSDNRVTYEWTHEAGAAPALSLISYAGVDIGLEYEPRPDVLIYATGDGALVDTAVRLHAVTETIVRTHERLRKYELTYAPGPGPSVLRTVQLVGGDGSTSLPPSTYATGRVGTTWKPAISKRVSGFGGNPPTWGEGAEVLDANLSEGSQAQVDPSQRTWLSLDADNDALEDLVWISSEGSATSLGADLNDGRGQFHLGLESKIEWGPGTTSPPSQPGCTYTKTCSGRLHGLSTAIGDVDGDGQEDIILAVPRYDAGKYSTLIRVMYGRPDGRFTEVRTGPALTRVIDGDVKPMVGDTNGDGRADLVIPLTAPACGGNGGLQVYLDDGTSGFSASGPASCWPTPVNPGHAQMVDVDGDGRADVGTFGPPENTDHGTSPSKNAQLEIALATSHGRFDMHVGDSGHAWTLEQSQTIEGRPCPANSVEHKGEFHSDTTTTHTPAEWVDMDSDGRTDLVVVQPGDHNDVIAHTFLSRGDGRFATQAWTTPVSLGRLQSHTRFDCAVPDKVLGFPDDFLLRDVSGDGTPDIVLVRNGVDSKTRRFAGPASVSLGDPISRGFTPQQSLTTKSWLLPCSTPPCLTPLTMLSDFTGDGSLDLGVITPDRDTKATSLHVVPGRPGQGSGPTLKADVNGDGLPDLVTVTQDDPDHLGLRAALQTNSGHGATRDISIPLIGEQRKYWNQDAWMVTDVNGDHIEDLVNIPQGDRNALVIRAGDWQALGLTLHQLDTTKVIPGSRERVCEEGPRGKPVCHWETADPVVVNNPALWPARGRWQVADVNGDGIQDLVHTGAGDRRTTLGPGVLTVFGSTGDGPAPEWAPMAEAGQSGWVSTDVDGDGSSDLVRVSGGHVTTLRHQGNSWSVLTTQVATRETTPSRLSPAAQSLYVDGGDDRAWVPAHLTNGPTGDLVRALTEPGTPRLLVETLTSRGDGTWSPVTQAMDLDPDSAPAAWQPVDLNSDDHTDLLGLIPGVSATLRTVEVTRSSMGWAVTVSDPDLPIPSPGYRRWAAETDRGQLQIASTPLRTGNDSSVATLTRTGAQPLVTRVDNGLGATTLVSYSSGTSFTASVESPEAECRTPVGTTPPVVTALTTKAAGAGDQERTIIRVPARLDGRTTTLAAIAQAQLGDDKRWTEIWQASKGRAEPNGARFIDPNNLTAGWTVAVPHNAPALGGGIVDRSALRYACFRYSDHLHRFMAWQTTTTRHPSSTPQAPATTDSVERRIDSGGVDQIVNQRTTLTATGKGLATTNTTYAPVGAIPYQNLMASTTSGTCNGAGQCANNITTVDTRNEFGVPTHVTEKAAGSGRTKVTQTDFRSDNTQWLHSMPISVQVTDPADSKFIRKTQTCYDGDTSAECDHLPTAARGLPTLTRQWDGTTWIETSSATYDAQGNITQVIDRGGPTPHTTTTTYDAELHLWPIKVTNALGQTTQSPLPWDRRAEAPTRTITPSGAVTSAHYDGLGRINTFTSPTGVKTTTKYATGPKGTTTTITTTTAAGTTWARTISDGLGHRYATQSQDAKGKVVSTESTYLNATLVGARTGPHYTSTEPTAYRTFKYDGLGRVIATTNADKTGTSAIRTLGADGLLSTTNTDEAGRWSTTVTDGWGAQIRLEVPSVEHHGTAITTMTYDVAGEPLTITDPHNNLLSYTWDALGQQTSQDDPDSGLTTYHHDSAGNVDGTTDARGREVHYRYDALNRRTSRVALATGEVAAWHYDEGGGSNTGLLTSVTDPSARGCTLSTSHRYTYDVLGDLLTDRSCTLGVPSTTVSKYDEVGHLKTLVYPDSRSIKYGYNRIGQLDTVSGFITHTAYDDAGRATATTFANSTTGKSKFDPSRGWLHSTQLARNTADAKPAIFDESYQYGPTGLVRATKSASTRQGTEYTYNPLGELKTSTDSLHPGVTDQIKYDDLGNLLTRSTRGDYTYPTHRACTSLACAGPHAATHIGGTTYTYDAAGNTLSRHDTTTTTYTWTSEEQLRQIHRPGHPDVTNTYDADGSLVATATGPNTVVFAGPAEHTAAGWADRVYAAGGLIGEMKPKRGGQAPEKRRNWFATDRSRSIRVITDYQGHPIGSVAYTAWGQPEGAAGTRSDLAVGGNRAYGGLVALGARTYDPSTGRMLSPDSVIPTIASPIALNRYAYALNAPTTYVDPSGHVPVDPTQQGHGLDWSWWSDGAPIQGFVPPWSLQDQPNYWNCVTVQCVNHWLNQQAQTTQTKTPTAGQAGSPVSNGRSAGSSGQSGPKSYDPSSNAAPTVSDAHIVDHYLTEHGWVTVTDAGNGTYARWAWNWDAISDFDSHYNEWLRTYTEAQRCSGPFCGLHAEDFDRAEAAIYQIMAEQVKFVATDLATAGIGSVLAGVVDIVRASKAAEVVEGAAPIIKAGARGGETAGKAFPQAVKEAAVEENLAATGADAPVCVWCRMETESPHIDHAVPRSMGGDATLENAQVACPHCNMSRGNGPFPITPPAGYEGPWPPNWWP